MTTNVICLLLNTHTTTYNHDTAKYKTVYEYENTLPISVLISIQI